MPGLHPELQNCNSQRSQQVLRIHQVLGFRCMKLDCILAVKSCNSSSFLSIPMKQSMKSSTGRIFVSIVARSVVVHCLNPMVSISRSSAAVCSSTCSGSVPGHTPAKIALNVWRVAHHCCYTVSVVLKLPISQRFKLRT